MGRDNFEHMLGFHCAPTFIGLKAASLVSFPKKKFVDFDALIRSYEPCFRCKGISVFRLAEGTEYVLMLFYRAATLRRLLDRHEARQLLQQFGYDEENTLAEQLEILRVRMQLQKSFPHEVGLFLGYPPQDVRGFIEHKGQDFSYSGYWKVYSNELAARALFKRYAACTEEFCLKLQEGIPMAELLQAV